MMEKLSIGCVVSVLMFLTACDYQEGMSRPKTEIRSMTIAGTPVYERDYQLQQSNTQHLMQIEESK